MYRGTVPSVRESSLNLTLWIAGGPLAGGYLVMAAFVSFSRFGSESFS